MTIDTLEMTEQDTDRWTYVCRYDDLTPGRGVAALVAGQQVAVFRARSGLYALDNLDPHSGAYVMSRGKRWSAIFPIILIASPELMPGAPLPLMNAAGYML